MHEVLDSNEVKLLIEGKPLPERRKPESTPPPEVTTQELEPQIAPFSAPQRAPPPCLGGVFVAQSFGVKTLRYHRSHHSHLSAFTNHQSSIAGGS